MSLSNLWFDKRTRAILAQVALIALIGVGLTEITHNVQTNLEARQIASGFDFLSRESGFKIPMHLIEYTQKDSYLKVFYVGLLNTLIVSVIGVFIATILGFVVGIGRLSSNRLVRSLCSVYVEVLRNVPLLLQIFFWYFAVLRTLPSPRNAINLGEHVFITVRGIYLPSLELNPLGISLGLVLILGLFLFFILRALTIKSNIQHGANKHTHWWFLGALSLGLCGAFAALGPIGTLDYPSLRGFNFRGGMALIPELIALTLALATYTAAFIAEVVRSGISAIEKGQLEAAQSLGLSKAKTLRLIIIPQAVRIIIPPMTNQYLNLTKNSSLGAACAYPDLVAVFAGTALNQTGQAIEIIAMTMAVYLTVSLSISAGMNLYQRSTRWGRES